MLQIKLLVQVEELSVVVVCLMRLWLGQLQLVTRIAFTRAFGSAIIKNITMILLLEVPLERVFLL